MLWLCGYLAFRLYLPSTLGLPPFVSWLRSDAASHGTLQAYHQHHYISTTVCVCVCVCCRWWLVGVLGGEVIATEQMCAQGICTELT